MRNAHNRPNRRAVRVGYALFATALVLLGQRHRADAPRGRDRGQGPDGALGRLLGARRRRRWSPRGCSCCTGWPGKRIRGRSAPRWAAGGRRSSRAVHAGPAGAGPAALERRGPRVGRAVLLPVARAHADRRLHPRATSLMNDAYCTECHADVHDGWAHSVHRFSSFNNPRLPVLACARPARSRCERDGNVQALALLRRLPRPGAVLQRRVRRPRLRRRATTRRPRPGITCTVCHAITHVNSAARQRRLHDRRAGALPVRLQRQRRCCAGSTGSWSRPSPSSTRRPSSSRCTRRPSSAAPATRCTCPRSSTTTSGCAARTTTTPSC